jgi:MFS family permease
VELYRTAPAGLVGCAAIGLANGAFWTFGPLAAKAQVTSSLGVSLYMSACLAGGALSQWPLGRLSDHLDRRWVIVALCLATAILGVLLTAQEQAPDAVLLILAALFGATALSVYPICVAHANDRADPSACVETSGLLLMAFGVGAAVGPFLVGLIVATAGIASLFVAIAAIHLTLAAFVLVRIALSRPVPGSERAPFASQPPIGHGTQPLVELQPHKESGLGGAPCADSDPPRSDRLGLENVRNGKVTTVRGD